MRLVVALSLAAALLVARGAPASACDPEWDWCGYEWYEPAWDPAPAYEDSWTSSWWEPAGEPAPIYRPPVYFDEPQNYYQPPAIYYEPPIVYEPPVIYEPPVYEPQPVALPVPQPAPAWTDPVVWSSPGSDVLDASAPSAQPPAPPIALVPDRDALRAQYGLSRVDSVWAGDVVLTDGLTTTFSTRTVAADPGTAARLAAEVGTGETSAYDGLLWNGRTALSDGRLVKGDVYTNYVWNGYDWVFDKYVFFQDDLEVATVTAPPVTPIAPTPATLPPALVAPVAISAPPVAPPAVLAPTTVPGAPISIALPADDAPAGPPSPVLFPSGTPPSTASRSVVAGIALGPQADPIGRVEVLRGRRVPLWVRATVDGAPARVVSWRLVSSEVIALGPIGGTGDDPFVATWRSVPSGGALVLRLRATVDVAGETGRDVDAAIEVVVRSPALIE